MLTGGLFKIRVTKELPGYISFEVNGKGAKKHFENEKGGIRWQRCPPTEKRGRIHTSSVTVAVLDSEMFEESEITLREWEYNIRTYKAGGKGGQHRNKTDSAVEITHYETGIVAKSDSERSQHLNKQIALEALIQKLKDHYKNTDKVNIDLTRKKQVGTGMRGDKIRTVQEQNNQVVDHRSGKKLEFKRYMKGEINELY